MGTRAAVVLGFGLSATVSVCAVAQPATRPVAEIVVTGSHLPSPADEAISTVQTYERAAFEVRGVATLEDFLNTLPAVTPDHDRSSNNPGRGIATVNLRALGARRTLVLLDGRRLAPTGVDGLVDVNAIPPILVERIDVLTGGASAVYGADAVAGVVNFRTRERFIGLELRGQAEAFGPFDGESWGIGGIAGAALRGGRGHVTAAFDRTRRTLVTADARDFSRRTIGDDPETGELFFSGTTTTPAGFINQDIRFPDGTVSVGKFLPGGSIAPFVDPDDRYNFAPDNALQTPLDRWTAAVFVHYDLAENLALRADVLSTRTETVSRLAPTVATLRVNAPLAASFFTQQAAALLAQFDPDHDGIANFGFQRRLVELGPRYFSRDAEYGRASAALEWRLSEAWRVDAYAAAARNRTHTETQNSGSRKRLLQGVLIDPATGACQDLSGGCVAVNLFGPDTLSPAAQAFIRLDDLVDRTEARQSDASLTVTGETPGPAGAIGLAFGVDWRRTATRLDPDPTIQSGDAIGVVPVKAVRGTLETREAFAEILAPLASDQPWADRLEAQASLRWTDTSQSDGVWTWGLGALWRVRANWTIRASAQRAIRAPNAGDLFTAPTLGAAPRPPSDDFCSAPNDPVGRGLAGACVAEGMAPSAVGVFVSPSRLTVDTITRGNPDLGPEAGRTYTLGLTYERPGPVAFRASVDLFRISLQGAIERVDPLFACADARGRSAACSQISRDPSGRILQLLMQPINIAQVRLKGVDYGFAISAPVPPGLRGVGEARLTASVQATTYFENGARAYGGSPFFDCTGLFNCIHNSLGVTLPKTTALASVGYAQGSISVDLQWRWIDGLRNGQTDYNAATGLPPPVLAIPKIGAEQYIDLSVGVPLGPAQLRVGIGNLLDNKPPLLASQQAQANTDPSRYTVLGRRYFATLTYVLR